MALWRAAVRVQRPRFDRRSGGSCGVIVTTLPPAAIGRDAHIDQFSQCRDDRLGHYGSVLHSVNQRTDTVDSAATSELVSCVQL